MVLVTAEPEQNEQIQESTAGEGEIGPIQITINTSPTEIMNIEANPDEIAVEEISEMFVSTNRAKINHTERGKCIFLINKNNIGRHKQMRKALTSNHSLPQQQQTPKVMLTMKTLDQTTLK